MGMGEQKSVFGQDGGVRSRGKKLMPPAGFPSMVADLEEKINRPGPKGVTHSPHSARISGKPPQQN